MFRISPRSWLILAVPVLGLLVLSVFSATSATTFERSSPKWRGAVDPARDRPLPGGGTAQLSKCGTDDWRRTAPRDKDERSMDPQLLLSGWGSSGPRPEKVRFTVNAVIRAGHRPLVLDAPVAEHRVTFDIYGPHGEGIRASARGLTATVMKELEDKPAKPAEPAKPPASGRFRVGPGDQLSLRVELPAGALCPGQSWESVGDCEPEHTNDVDDCPSVALTLADPAIRAYRAETGGERADGRRPSDRLVAVFPEADASPV